MVISNQDQSVPAVSSSHACLPLTCHLQMCPAVPLICSRQADLNNSFLKKEKSLEQHMPRVQAEVFFFFCDSDGLVASWELRQSNAERRCTAHEHTFEI